ncbi:hypothetical protein AAC387_Pa01g4154 [Persea americana]
MKPFINTLVVIILVITLYQLPPPTPSDRKKRIFLAYCNAAALFVQMGTYHVNPFAFAIVGLAQVSAVNGDIPACVSAMSGDIPAH